MIGEMGGKQRLLQIVFPATQIGKMQQLMRIERVVHPHVPGKAE